MRPLSRPARFTRASGFSLLELLIVIGILALLISLLLPALAKARRQSMAVQCGSNMRQCFQSLLIYANEHNGWMFPEGWGSNQEPRKRWPVYVFKPPAWNPPILRCPADIEPVEEHSYVLNNHLSRYQIRYSSTRGISSSNVILMGEKKTTVRDYYMDLGDFERVVEPYRHGLYFGSNHLFLDGHVDPRPPHPLPTAIDPWDPAPSSAR